MTNTSPIDLDSIPPFDAKARADWLALVEKGLRGAAVETLDHTTQDGLKRGPLTTLNDRPIAPAAIMRSGAPLLAGRPWHICAPVRDGSLAFANEQLLADLTGGASAARITLQKTPADSGVVITRASDLQRLFDKVHTDLIPISFRSVSTAHIDAIFDTPTLESAHVTLGLDILEHGHILPDVIAHCPKDWRALTLRPMDIHEAGGTDVQELAVMAASVVHAMNTLGAEHAHKHMSIEIAVDRDAHLTIAKVRAARRIYARIANNYGLADSSVPLYAMSSKRMMQRVDPWTNMLRSMSAGFGAVVGGADYVTLLPFTAALGTPTPFGHRIARNMQLMMMEESHLGQVSDAAHGSYFHERMSDELAQAAWRKFQDIEAKGGIEIYHSSGEVTADCKIAIEDRNEENAPIVGVTLHRVENLRQANVRETQL